MKKRYKAILTVGFGFLVYGVGIMLGVSFLGNNDSIQDHQQQVATSKASYMPTESPESLSKWVAEIHPAAGENGANK